MKLTDFCKGLYKSCRNLTSQYKFIKALFNAAGGCDVSESYGKKLFYGTKEFTDDLKDSLRGKDNLASLTDFFENEIDNPGDVLVAFGIPEKDKPNRRALAIALAHQMKLLIDSTEYEVENILALQYQQAKQGLITEDANIANPLYRGDSIFVHQSLVHKIQSYDTVTHIWELTNTGAIPWKGRKLVYKRGPKDRPEASPSIIEIPDIQPKKSIKIATTISGRGFDGITRCRWEMQDADGENCFPKRESLFCVTIDAKFKRE